MLKIKALMIAILLILSAYTTIGVIAEMPTFGRAENPIHNEVYKRYVEDSMEDTGVPNMVTSIVLDYRAYDTMFETTVLFAATTAVVIALKAVKKEGDSRK